jgi:SAM-dependent methyltransferase
MTKIFEGIQAIIDRMATNQTLRVLEAGCGSFSHFRFPGSRAVGIDLSQEQLDRNTQLDEKILGDIETFRLEASSFDIIFCWDVLEHLDQPEKALVNFAQSLRQGGIIVLGGPVARCLKGTIAKHTPLWFHVLVYRKVLGFKDAGKPGLAPFRVVFKDSMSPPSLMRFAHENGFLVELFTLYEGSTWVAARKRMRFIDLGLRILGPVMKILSLGRLDPGISDFVMVLRKSAPFPAITKPQSAASKMLIPGNTSPSLLEAGSSIGSRQAGLG